MAPQIPDVKKVAAELRARKVLNYTLETLGFTRVFNGRVATFILETLGGTIAICEDGNVSIKGEFRCLVPADGYHAESKVPWGDVLLSKLLSLCTKSRRSISTLRKSDQEFLDKVLPLEKTRPLLAKIIKEVASEGQRSRPGNPG